MYGENGGNLRAELTTLLHHHRVQQRLGGAGIHTVPETTTEQERADLGNQIRRFRHGLLVWCHQAARAANPRIILEGTSARSRGPAEELRCRLSAAVDGSKASLPTLDELTSPQQFPLVESWRLAARAAALGEHDFDAGVGYGRLSKQECMTVLKDAAEVAYALVVVDKRYANIPGWESLPEQGRLGRAALVCAVFAGYGEPDYTVDLRGWWPPASTIDPPPRDGIAGVVQAEHNLLIHLTCFPDALNLKRVLDSQRALSRCLAVRVEDTAPELAENWTRRALTFANLQLATGNVAGQVGNGGSASAEGANTLTRLRAVPVTEPLDDRAVRTSTICSRASMLA
jgi:hypothetical protein